MGIARKVMATAAAASIIAVLTSGCVAPRPYKPDRTVVRSIPVDLAKSELVAILARAHPGLTNHHPSLASNRLDGIEVTDAGLAFDSRASRSSEKQRFSFRYVDLEPAAYEATGETDVIVRLVGPEVGSATPLTPDEGIIVVPSAADAEKLIDAIESLKAASTARRP